jgi:hypothetical protein
MITIRELPSERPYTPESTHNNGTTVSHRVADRHLSGGSCNHGYCKPHGTWGCHDCMRCTYKQVKGKPKWSWRRFFGLGKK